MHHDDSIRTTHSARDSRGFTLIELMIVAAVIAIIASITIPGYVQGRVAAHESAVVGTMRTFATAQFKFKAMGLVDTDDDGGYEFGAIRELTGGTALRGTANEFVPQKLLSASFDNVDAQGRIMKHGYYFQLYLPDAAGNGAPETTAGLATVDAAMASNYWSLVAWPIRKSQSGSATYFVNHQGEVVKSRSAPYDGLTNVPPAGPALVGTGDPARIDSNAVAVEATGADGNHWTPVR